MSYPAQSILLRSAGETSSHLLASALKALHWWLNIPTLMFLVMLAAMLFRPPDLKAFPIDRIAFLALIILVCLRFLLRWDSFRTNPVTWPLLAFLLLGFWGALTQPYDAQVWSVFAAKYVVPFVCFHVAAVVFRDEGSRRALEVFLLCVLVYLSAISVFWLASATSLIFPTFINDPGIGIHFDRARGPFLQAVANGVCLNLLGLTALDCYRRKKVYRVIGIFLLFAVPLALFATKTRAVWISGALSTLALLRFGSGPIRRVAIGICVAGALSAGVISIYRVNETSVSERLLDRSPVDFRSEMYRAGWQMFTEKSFLGWGNEWNIQPEVEKRVRSFHPEYYVFHNTFLELAVERGVLGLGVYAWLLICLFRLRNYCRELPEIDTPFCNAHFRALWPLLLLVYLANAIAVVMNYQFVNAILFTIAGILAANSSNPAKLENLQRSWAASA
ncbi:MAG TPA: O-antigen ligase family protein [Terriglobales bacterium]|nr:O-antigen ligase family protein [Terriglobales bacterium]